MSAKTVVLGQVVEADEAQPIEVSKVPSEPIDWRQVIAISFLSVYLIMGTEVSRAFPELHDLMTSAEGRIALALAIYQMVMGRRRGQS